MIIRLVPKSNDLELQSGRSPLYCIISPSQCDLDYILMVLRSQSRDTMSNFAMEQRFLTNLLNLCLVIFSKVV